MDSQRCSRLSSTNSVYILGFSVIATVATLYKAGGLCWSKENLRKIMNEDAKFSDMERRYKNVKMKDAMIWELPLEHYHVMNATIEADQDVLYKHAKVIHDYKAQNEEELNIREGDVIMDVIELENGWWQGNLNGVIGYFPGEYVEFIENKKKSGAVSDASLISETSSFYLKQRFGTYDTWRGYDKKGKVKKGDYQQLKAEDKEHDDANKIEAIPGSPMHEKSDATQPKKKTKKHSKKKYTEIDNLSSIENLTESKFFGDENSEGSATNKEQRKRKKKSKYDKEQTSPKADEESKKRRKRRKKHTESHSDEQQSIESDTALLSSEISTEKEAKKKKGHKGSEGSRDKKSKKRKRKHKEYSGEQPITEKSASILESASGETLRKRNKQKGKKDEGLSDDELFLAGADSPLMSLTDVSSGEDKKPPTKGIFRRLFKW
ncbi:uncharacterized G-patch domain protein DDB_G0278987-like isoform X2 [Dysidea avara]|uniref:uncharacterized G-patch domain protein DDB_G0278987-like isoform X2 n=1 Tax=Dysidea avara TaxID=196820 RepID=UPI003327A97A